MTAKKKIFSKCFIDSIIEIYKENGLELTRNEAKNHAMVFCVALLRTFLEGNKKVQLSEFGSVRSRRNRTDDYTLVLVPEDEVRKRLTVVFSRLEKGGLV